ncbi:hypothetical protein PHMEG_00030748 [Phytophthora megakarya]|uniref:Reverse transcriptase domain-containing protein n=1 Tax=Phytophthora megakarya TaxID=4795 RepID=A0A225UZC5_9STRA|nr:hypothetical protein PHMEG_00030748 [Phytophthora megakarya]
METQEKDKATPVSFFVPLLAPTIKSTSHAALVEWKKKREEYEAEVAIRCCHDPAKIAEMTTKVCNSFEPSLLEVLCDLEWGVKKAELTDALVLSKIDGIIASVKNGTVPNVAAEFKLAVRMDLQQSDVRERVVQFFKSSRQVIEENGWAEFFKDHEGLKLKCKLLVSSIEPQALREDIEAILAYQNRAARTDEKVLFKIILEKALEHERDFQRRKRQRAGGRSGGIANDPVEAGRVKKKMRSKGNVGTRLQPGAVKAEMIRETNTETTRMKHIGQAIKKPDGGCLKCKGDHWLVQCPEATHEEKTALLRQQHERRDREKADKRKVARADVSVISRSQLMVLEKRDPTVKMKPLQREVSVTAAGGHSLHARNCVEVDLKIHTAAGPVCFTTPVRCLVIEEEEKEFIIGKDVLETLGIDVDRQLEQLAVNSDAVDDDPFEFEDEFTIGVECDADVRAAVEEMLDKAIEKGFPDDRRDELRTVVFLFDIWRLKLGNDPPAKVPPLLVRLKDGATSQRCKPRQYPPHLRAFLRDFNAELERMGWVYENPQSRWASAALPVKKPGSEEYRQTSDYRSVNSVTEVAAGVMPILRVLTENVRGMKHFGLFDLLKGFWQLPVAKECQEFLSYMTDSKVFTPTRVPQGCSDAAIHFQRTMEKCFEKLLHKHLLVWVDDLLLYASNVDEYLEKLQEFFSLVNEFGLKLSTACDTIQSASERCVRCHAQTLPAIFNNSSARQIGYVKAS